MEKKNALQLAQLTDMASPAAVFEEVKCNFIRSYPVREFGEVRKAFHDFNLLFDGKYPGYRKCNTKFHDKVHTTDALLAISRMIDGYNLTRAKLPAGDVKTALIATIFHDTGYIQQKSDKKGTGAKYTLNHVERSVEFIRRYFKASGMPQRSAVAAGRMVCCTGLSVDLKKLNFASRTERLLGFMLGTSDLLGQMASRTYLERLLYLYGEFREGHVQGYSSEIELLKKTLGFYAETQARLRYTLEGVNGYLVRHFRQRYGINRDLYAQSIEKQMYYLKEILKCEKTSLRALLRRSI